MYSVETRNIFCPYLESNPIALSSIAYPNHCTDCSTLAHYFHEMFFVFSGWSGIILPAVASDGVPLDVKMNIDYCWINIWQGRTEMSSKKSSPVPCFAVGLNPSLRGEKPASNSQKYCTAIRC
jgi:hypothetical protein